MDMQSRFARKMGEGKDMVMAGDLCGIVQPRYWTFHFFYLEVFCVCFLYVYLNRLFFIETDGNISPCVTECIYYHSEYFPNVYIVSVTNNSLSPVCSIVVTFALYAEIFPGYLVSSGRPWGAWESSEWVGACCRGVGLTAWPSCWESFSEGLLALRPLVS